MPSVQEALATAKATGDVGLKPCDYLTPEYQLGPPYKVAILHLLMIKRLVLRDPVGTGKTACALGAYAYYRQTNPGSTARLLVLTTSSAQFQWKAEVERLTTFSAEVYGYNGNRALSPAKRVARYGVHPADVWITTYGLAARDREVLGAQPFLFVLDEIQIVRGPEQRTIRPASRALSEKAIAAWGLSATPLMNKIENLYGIFDVIMPGLLGTPEEFEKRYVRTMDLKAKKHTLRNGRCVLCWARPGDPRLGLPCARAREFKKVIGYRNIAELTERLRPFTLQRTEKELEAFLPAVQPLRRLDVELGPVQRKLYDSYISQMPDAAGELTITQKVTAMQMAARLAGAPDVMGHPGVPSAKWEALYEFLKTDAADQPALVYTFYATTAQWLKDQCDAAGLSAALITGSMTSPQRYAVQTAFQTNKVRIVILTSAGNYGVNLRSPFFIFYDMPWVWGDAVQAVGRARRRGHCSGGTLVVAAVIALNSIDEHILKTLRGSQDLNQRVLAPLTSARSSTTISPNSPKHSALSSILPVIVPVVPVLPSSSPSVASSSRRSSEKELWPLEEEGTESTQELLDPAIGITDAATPEAASLWASLTSHAAPAPSGPLPTFVVAPEEG